MATINLLLPLTLLVIVISNASFFLGKVEASKTQFRINSVYTSNSSRIPIVSNFTPISSFYYANGSRKDLKIEHRLESLLPLSTENRSIDLYLDSSKVVIRGNSTISSNSKTFELGFFSTNGEPNWYLGIWYASISTPTYVWVANRDKPIKNLTFSTLEITVTGRLVVKESGSTIVWQSTNTEISKDLSLLENGNLVLLTHDRKISWQSFDYPTDTWLPGMNLTAERVLTSWSSLLNPSRGLYSLRLIPPHYGEFVLVFNRTKTYWTTGNWTGEAFANVPEMMMPYIYSFYFVDPYKPTASFGFSERPLPSEQDRPLTRFRLEHSGQLRQYTWSKQTASWDMFWSQPDNPCRVFGLCGELGLCTNNANQPCECLSGFSPVSESNWQSGDYSNGCRRFKDVPCENGDDFEQVGFVNLYGTQIQSFTKKWRDCSRLCLKSCSCIGFLYNEKTSSCSHLSGSPLNLQNLSSDGSVGTNVLYIRSQRGESSKKHLNPVVLATIILGSLVVLGFVVLVGLFLMRRRQRKGAEEEGIFPVLNLKVFTYKELHGVTRGFSEKLGHGGFGTVFRGELSDFTIVAVKRLERPGGGEKEFRAEVCTIGNIQHVNLVRLRGFCSESTHRLLVYDYMPNGALSSYLRREGPRLSWDIRFRVAIGTARGIAYLHEECRDCIIHCDIKPENILLDRDYTAKVSDFGLAKLLCRDYSRVIATMRGTWGYVAPEWISGVEITTKADVYSYGMTLIELIAGRRNVEPPPSAGGRDDGGETPEKWFFPPWAAQLIIDGNVAAVIDNRLGNAYDIEQARRVALVAVWCIQDDEAMRPTMGMVVKMLEGVVEVTVPQAPKLLQALVSGESFHGVKGDSGNGVCSGAGSRFADENTRLSSGCSEASLSSPSSQVNENGNDLPKKLIVSFTDQD
ncbi:hypothetical protein FNV43_RR15439 [Rhamnella rubrinervis]|uniref:Receptor-like serine/threonine-protein kinase n=1 Tax=Rhamnella rubrinervis TaxID=2594499 RepID=A0A8K0E923_9ROSA|nr:hypothetical protein FNV43_RR15439 [Rhamnella rubrinervis]